MKQTEVSKKMLAKTHPAIPEAYDQLCQGRISRREFLRLSTLLGLSAGVAYFAAGCAQPTEAPPAATVAPAAGGIKRGGTFTRAMELQLIDHPARFSWVQQANVVRHVAEYLTETGTDNITRPLLLEKWEASEDVKTWTLNLRKGVKFNNGDEFTADDVLFNFEQWLNPDVGSSILSMMSYLNGPQDVEKVDDYTVRLHLKDGNIGIPEHLFHYPANIVHRSFEGDFIKQPIGTGAFTLAEYTEGERAVLKRRNDYWKMGEDGQPLPYLDEITYVSMAKDAAVAAVQSGQVDCTYQPRASDWQALKDLPNMQVLTAPTAVTTVLRMRVDVEPWTDVRVRNALKMCQDREKILQLSYYGQGDLGVDAHIAPVHPEYCDKPVPKYDPEGAKKLLAEAGYPDGLKVTLATKNDLEEPEYAQALKEQAAAGGFDITLDITEPGGYWDRWTEVDLGMTSWTHRPLGTQVLRLGYTSDADGKPVEWNETRWVDKEFEELLATAESTLDVEERRKIMCQIEDIFIERGPIGIAYWKSVWNIVPKTFKNIQAHPTEYDLLNEVWKDEA
ncbi:MAG: ABC transporter substrate-binding protein [Anaerolineales bacterium]|nr:ABC transporter substrate-binding protein [Anaerolineales bacterium]